MLLKKGKKSLTKGCTARRKTQRRAKPLKQKGDRALKRRAKKTKPDLVERNEKGLTESVSSVHLQQQTQWDGRKSGRGGKRDL